jgi:spermidine synthase
MSTESSSSSVPSSSPANPVATDEDRRLQSVLLISVFVAGISGLVYELLIGTVSSYLLGDSVTQFSLTIGLAMSAMGVGTLISRWIHTRLLEWFLLFELALGLVGGVSVMALLAAYRLPHGYEAAFVLTVLAIGVLIGTEIPLLARILDRRVALRENISNVLSLDYFGSLAATLLFPFVLMPFLGPYRSAPLAGLLNLCVVWLGLITLRSHLAPKFVRPLVVANALATLILSVAFFGTGAVVDALESGLYEDRVIHAEQSAYQRIVLTRDRQDVRLYLNGHLQFATSDEHRYHESLARVPALLLNAALAESERAAGPLLSRVLILGGGDGLLARELLRIGAERIDIIDLDPAVTELARIHPALASRNGGALDSSQVRVLHQDAFRYLTESTERYDLILADLPDPNDATLSRLYSREFYMMTRERLKEGGAFATQATSPFFATEAFWCIARTIKEAGFRSVVPYHALVPSMGDWGFVVASDRLLQPTTTVVEESGRFLDAATFATLFVFAPDLMPVATDINTLARPAVLAHYLDGWRTYR